MNLCGGIVNVTESEQLLLEIPDEKFQLTPRRKASSSAPSRRRQGVPGSIDTDRRTPTERRSSSNSRPSSTRSRSHPLQSPVAAPSPTFLNPLSNDDLNKSRSRRPAGPPLHSTKGSSVVIKKLEIGFNVTLITADGDKKNVLLDVHPEKLYLRMRHHDDDNTSDNENDGYKSNHSVINLKVTDITRLEVGREKASKKSSSSPRPVKSFSVIMRKKIGGSNIFNFEAATSPERDEIIGGIKGVLELTKTPSETRRRRSSQSPQVSNGRSVRKSRTNPSSRRETHRAKEGKKDRDAEYFDFDIPYDGPEVAIEAEVRNDTNDRASGDDRDRACDSDGEKSGTKRKSKNNELAITVIENSDLKDTAIEVAGSTWGVDDIFCGIATGGTGIIRRSNDSDEAQSSKVDTNQALQEINEDAFLYDTIGCNPLGFGGCNSQALAAVEDVELAAMAANEVSTGPFCTDDVCGAGLKDFTDTMKGIFEMKQNLREGKPTEEQHRVMAEDYISGVLGAPATVANLLSVKDMWKTAPQLPKQKRRSLQNRSRNRNAQAARLARLRKQMTFDANESSTKMPFVQIVSSYDDVERSGRFGKKLTSGVIAKGSRSDSSLFLKNVVENMERQQDDSDADEEILYYDSDPEDARVSSIKRGPRRAAAEYDNLSSLVPPRQEALCNIPTSKISLSRRLRRVDDELVKEIIDTMKNEQMTLMWHPGQSKDNRNRAPFCAKVWIESGIYLIDGTFLLPKLTWVPVFEEALQTKVLNVTLSNPGTIDLLDVCRVRECTKIDRRMHPFANAECSFIIQTQKETQLFEAHTKAERTRIVDGLRLVIARLASLLMLRDLRAVDEFFGGNAVPGEAPGWAQSNSDSASDAAAPSLP